MFDLLIGKGVAAARCYYETNDATPKSVALRLAGSAERHPSLITAPTASTGRLRLGMLDSVAVDRT